MKYLALLSVIAAVFAQNETASDPTLTDLLASTDDLSTLNGLVGTLPNGTLQQLTAENASFTIFAPSNSAFEKLNSFVLSQTEFVQQTLIYHVIRGVHASEEFAAGTTFLRSLASFPQLVNLGQGEAQVVYVQNGSVYSGAGVSGSLISTADVRFQGGIVHIIDTVLTIPGTASAAAQGAGLTSLVEAVQTTNLTSTVDDTAGITILAPNNDAFAAVGNVSDISVLSNILSYHVITGVYYSTTLGEQDTLPSAEGTDVYFHSNDSGAYFNGAKLVTANVLVKNGVVHVIDSVLTPDTAAQFANSTGSGGNSTSGDDSSDSGVEDGGAAAGLGDVNGTAAETTAPNASGARSSPSNTEAGGASSSSPPNAAVGMIVNTGVLTGLILLAVTLLMAPLNL